MPEFWIGKSLQVIVDRPLGSAHPRFEGTVYPVNYGFVPGTLAADGREIDAYVLGVERPLDRFEGTCIAILHRECDVEDKLVVAPAGIVVTDQQICESLDFQEKYFRVRLLR